MSNNEEIAVNTFVDSLFDKEPSEEMSKNKPDEQKDIKQPTEEKEKEKNNNSKKLSSQKSKVNLITFYLITTHPLRFSYEIWFTAVIGLLYRLMST